MIIFTHVVIALVTIVLTLVTYVKPTSRRLKMSYTGITLTVVSGSYLAFSLQSNLLRTCVTGLVFVTFTSILTYSSRNKLEYAENKIKVEQ